MALTPERDEAFFRQVDEDLRRDQLAGVARRYGRWIVGGVLLLLALLAAALWWRSHQARQAGADGEILSPVATALARGGGADPAALKPLEGSPRPAYRAMARLAEAAILAQRGDAARAAAGFEAVANDGAADQPVRDLALLRATALRFDALPPTQVVDRLKGLAIKGNPWFGSAGELTGLAWLKLGRKDRAGRIFAAVAGDAAVPASLRGRAAGLATSLGQTVRPIAGPATLKD